MQQLAIKGRAPGEPVEPERADRPVRQIPHVYPLSLFHHYGCPTTGNYYEAVHFSQEGELPDAFAGPTNFGQEFAASGVLVEPIVASVGSGPSLVEIEMA